MDKDKLFQMESSFKKLNVVHTVSLPVVILLCVWDFFYMVMSMNNGNYNCISYAIIFSIALILVYVITNAVYKRQYDKLSVALEEQVLDDLDLSSWKFTQDSDDFVYLKSSKAVDNYDDIKYFKENEGKLDHACALMLEKAKYLKKLQDFLDDNEYKDFPMYRTLDLKLQSNLLNSKSYNIAVVYTSPTGRSQNHRILDVSPRRLKELVTDKSLLMSKGEYNKYLKEQGKALLEDKQHQYYEKVNNIIDLANDNKENLVIKSDTDELDKLIATLFDRTVNSIKKIKSIDSDEWYTLDKFISGIEEDVRKITDKNSKILDYYASDEFLKIKNTCDTLMSSQREFNEYIDEKVNSISSLFGTAIVREETSYDDEFNYIHPYKKRLTPFTAEVSSAVFASAENSPLEYVVKQFYPNKTQYPEQIQKLQLLIEELETLKEAKQIIETYKADIQHYLSEVPEFIMEYDEDGFYSRLGFATINEKTLVVAYKFSYTSNGGKAQRSFTVPMTEETIIALIQMLENKLTFTAFAKEQRAMMTAKLRQLIKERDNYTCRICSNSTEKEPNLLLEIDHKIPVAKGGLTEESNLQTLCWRCNRSKGSKLI